MARYYYASSLFPFSKVFPLGIVLVIVGVVSISFGIVDLIYTHLKYVASDCTASSYVGWSCPSQPCDSESLGLALAAPGIWSGALMVAAGAVSTSLVYASSYTIRIKRDATAAMTGVLSIPVAPIVFLLCVFRIYYMNGSFFCMNGDKLTITDSMEFLMPIFLLIVIIIGWCISLAILVALLQKGTLTERTEQVSSRLRNPSLLNLDSSNQGPFRPYVYPSLDQTSGWSESMPTYSDKYLSGKGYPYMVPTPVDGSYVNYSYPGRAPAKKYYTTDAIYSRY